MFSPHSPFPSLSYWHPDKWLQSDYEPLTVIVSRRIKPGASPRTSVNQSTRSRRQSRVVPAHQVTSRKYGDPDVPRRRSTPATSSQHEPSSTNTGYRGWRRARYRAGDFEPTQPTAGYVEGCTIREGVEGIIGRHTWCRTKAAVHMMMRISTTDGWTLEFELGPASTCTQHAANGQQLALSHGTQHLTGTASAAAALSTPALNPLLPMATTATADVV
ncbi:hypothetical protein B0H34DRAFT_801210 [Crassisporium funariophilum]|nr:hypothetical protein B0H34DRAFT_801210 [Crassisporium funariophilum]